MDRRALFGLAGIAVAAAAAPVRASEGGDAAEIGYARLPTLTANVRRADGRMGIMTVETGLDCISQAMAQRVAHSRPRLRAAYTRIVQDEANALLPGMAPDVERLIDRLKAETERVLGGRGARILIGTVMVV